jgi:type IV pilus assembly protein PilA
MKPGVPQPPRARGRRSLLHEQQGFTMVELMIVVLVIGILIAIAIPTFLGSRNRAYNRSAQSDLRAALIGAKTIYSTNGSYQCATAANGVAAPCVGIGMPSVERALTYQTTASTTAAPNVSITSAPTAILWAAARMSKSGTCFGIRDVPTTGTWYGQSLATCTGLSAATAANTPNRRWT